VCLPLIYITSTVALLHPQSLDQLQRIERLDWHFRFHSWVCSLILTNVAETADIILSVFMRKFTANFCLYVLPTSRACGGMNAFMYGNLGAQGGKSGSNRVQIMFCGLEPRAVFNKQLRGSHCIIQLLHSCHHLEFREKKNIKNQCRGNRTPCMISSSEKRDRRSPIVFRNCRTILKEVDQVSDSQGKKSHNQVPPCCCIE
jgi:hypothetical protein